MGLVHKMRWMKMKLRFGDAFDAPLRGTNIGKISLQIAKGGQLKAKSGFSCRDYVSINLSGGVLTIGNDCFINEGSKLNSMASISIGNGCRIGQNVLMYDHDHDYRDYKKMRSQFVADSISIGDDVWICSNVTILCGTKIGNRCVIGAGTVVKGEIPDDTLVYTERELVIKRIIREGI